MAFQIPVDETDNLEWLFDHWDEDYEQRLREGRLALSEIHDEYHDTIDGIINSTCPYCIRETNSKNAEDAESKEEGKR